MIEDSYFLVLHQHFLQILTFSVISICLPRSLRLPASSPQVEKENLQGTICVFFLETAHIVFTQTHWLNLVT